MERASGTVRRGEMLSMKRVRGPDKGYGVDDKTPCLDQCPAGFLECNPRRGKPHGRRDFPAGLWV